MLCYDNLSYAMHVVVAFVLKNFIVFWAMNETNHVGILLNGSRFAQVAQLRPLAIGTVTAFNATVELAEGNDWNVQLLCKTFKRTGNGTHLLLTAIELHTTGIHQLQVVDENY